MARYKPSQWARQGLNERREGSARAKYDAVQRQVGQTIVAPDQATYEPIYQRLGMGYDFTAPTSGPIAKGEVFFQSIVIPEGVDVHRIGVGVGTPSTNVATRMKLAFYKPHETELYPCGPPHAQTAVGIDVSNWISPFFRHEEINAGLVAGNWWVAVLMYGGTNGLSSGLCSWMPSLMSAGATADDLELMPPSPMSWDTNSCVYHGTSANTTFPTIASRASLDFDNFLQPVVWASMRPLA